MSQLIQTTEFLFSSAPPLPLHPHHWSAIVGALCLSPKQALVVELALRGLSDKEIARVMQISEPTVRTYFERISVRTRTRGRMELAMKVLAVSHQNRGKGAVIKIDDTFIKT